MKTKHTPEPWDYNRSDVGLIQISTSPANKPIAQVEFSDSFNERQANAARIVACVNACEGINPEAVSEMLAVLQKVNCFWETERDAKSRYSHEVRAAIRKATK